MPLCRASERIVFLGPGYPPPWLPEYLMPRAQAAWEQLQRLEREVRLARCFLHSGAQLTTRSCARSAAPTWLSIQSGNDRMLDLKPDLLPCTAARRDDGSDDAPIRLWSGSSVTILDNAVAHGRPVHNSDADMPCAAS